LHLAARLLGVLRALAGRLLETVRLEAGTLRVGLLLQGGGLPLARGDVLLLRVRPEVARVLPVLACLALLADPLLVLALLALLGGREHEGDDDRQHDDSDDDPDPG